MKYYITGTRRGLGKALVEKYGNCDSLEECDIFINCKHWGYEQVELLYKAAELGKRIINIGSNSPDRDKHKPWPYAVEKAALDAANDQLYYQGVKTSIIRFGYFESPRIEHLDVEKMSMEYCLEVIQWVIDQPHIVKDITISPGNQ